MEGALKGAASGAKARWGRPGAREPRARRRFSPRPAGTGEVCRAHEVRVEYEDVRGTTTIQVLRGYEARIFQHEFDHCQGVLHLDRFSPEGRKQIQPELDRLVQDYEGDDGILDLPSEVVGALQPPPMLRPGRMPPVEAAGVSASSSKAAAPKVAAPKMGFGGGGSAAAKPKAKKKKKK